MTVWMAAVLLAAGPVEVPAQPAAQPAAETQQVIAPREGAELRTAVRESLKRWAKVDDKHAQQAARDFLVLYRELQDDTKLAESQRDQYRTKVRSRLMALETQLRKRAAIERRLAKQNKEEKPKSVDTNDADTALGQMGAGMMGGGIGGGGIGMGMGGMQGGGMRGTGGVFGPNTDAGQELADVIQTTIAPMTWERNGGRGSIYYWRPGRALIIRQTGEVHGNIGGLMGALGNN